MKNLIPTFLTALVLTACGQQGTDLQEGSFDGWVVKARATVALGSGGSSREVRGDASGTQDLTVTVTGKTDFVLNNSDFAVPAFQQGIMDFGYLEITTLFDNDLKVCGVAGNEKCTTAVFRSYTTGVAGEGIYNPLADWGAPITILFNDKTKKIKLEAANAVQLQSKGIGNRNVVRLEDFDPAPRYNITADFTEAGAGAYGTTLVIEYGVK